MINTVIKMIEEQQAGKEDTSPHYVGEQLKDIIRNNPQAAEIVGQDLKLKEMSIVECEKKIKKYADEHRKKNFAFVSPQQAEKIICEFYGINKSDTRTEPQPQPQPATEKIVSIADLL